MPFFFQFTFREYDAGTPVKTFAMKDFNAAEGLIERTGQTLLNPTVSVAGEPLRLSAKLSNKDEKSLGLPAGTAAVRELSVKLGSYAYTDCQVVRSCSGWNLTVKKRSGARLGISSVLG